MTQVQLWTYIVVGITFALYIWIGYANRVRDTKGFYVAGQGVPPIANGAATAADWMSAASFISMAGLISTMGYDGAIYLRSAEGSKLVSVVINEWVAFEIDGYVPEDNHAWSVVAHGKAELLGNQEIEEQVEGLPLFPWNTSPKNRFIKIDVLELSGRSFIATGRHPRDNE